ncbi:MAG TPA: hypothetical protein PKY82_35150, partial [Pyrinomonadaceae bacterium]|nr:hypothetical protein [Pyrinomonadaceae bacterium]
QLQSEKERIRAARDQKISSRLFTEADEKQFSMANADLESQIQSMQLQALLRIGQQMIVTNSFNVKKQNDLSNAQNREAMLRKATEDLIGH